MLKTMLWNWTFWCISSGSSLYSAYRSSTLEKLSTVHARTLNRLQQLMLEYDFQIQYKPGKDNVVSDFLSRNPISAVDISRSSLKYIQAKDPLISRLLSDLHNGLSSWPLNPFCFWKMGSCFTIRTINCVFSPLVLFKQTFCSQPTTPNFEGI